LPRQARLVAIIIILIITIITIIAKTDHMREKVANMR
jgi:hypothetical protein